MVRAHLVLTGGSQDFFSPYSTTTAISFKAPPSPANAVIHPPPTSSGVANSYYRDGPPPSTALDDKSVARGSFSRPITAEPDQQWPGPKDATPLNSCLRRGETKEPRFHPFTIGSETAAHRLIQPVEADPAWRFRSPPPIFKGPEKPKFLSNKGSSCSSGFALGNGLNESKALINASQGQAEFHPPALTMLQAERVISDSTRRYFHARDYYDSPFLSSSSFYQADCLSAHADMQARKESLTAAPATRPLTQYALAHNDAPFAPDTDSSWDEPSRALPGPVPIAALAHEAAGVSTESKLPTGFTRVKGITNATGQTAEELPHAPPLPERFQRERARRDYLRWGSDPGGPVDMYRSTARMELQDPARQVPVGGRRKVLDSRVVATDTSGYHMQIVSAPIV